MAIVIVILIAFAAFWVWSVNGAKNTKRKVVVAFLRALEDRIADNEREPSWWREAKTRKVLDQALVAVPTRAAPYDPDIIREWLEAGMTQDDISTFLYHAETLGLSPSEQIALAPEVAVMFLTQDLIKAPHPLDKLVMLRLVAAMKKGHGQTHVAMPEFSYGVVEKFYKDFGGKDDTEEMNPLDPMHIYCDFPFRTGKFTSWIYLSDDPKSVPDATVYNYEPGIGQRAA